MKIKIIVIPSHLDNESQIIIPVVRAIPIIDNAIKRGEFEVITAAHNKIREQNKSLIFS